MTQSRTMIHFPDGTRRFNFRVAGVALRAGHVLVCREDDDDFTMLPGGRVEIGEPSGVALAREIGEELKCAGDIGRLLFTAENFFHLKNEEFHQVALYYALSLPESFPFLTEGPSFISHDEGHELTFSWVPHEPAALAGFNLLPAWLYPRFADLPLASEHVIVDER